MVDWVLVVEKDVSRAEGEGGRGLWLMLGRVSDAVQRGVAFERRRREWGVDHCQLRQDRDGL